MIKIKHSWLFHLNKGLLIILVGLCVSACSNQPQDLAENPVLEDSKQGNTTSSPPYAIGSRSLFIHDESRPFDSVGGVTAGIRSLLTEIWYPVSKETIASGAYQKATYGDYSFGDKQVHKLMLTNTTFFHLTSESVVDGVSQEQIEQAIEELFKRPRASYINAPVASTSQPFPVVVMTHGDAGSRYNMQTACEYLAAHGYVVIAPEHTGNTPFAFTAKDPAINDKLAEVKELLNEDGTYGPKDNYGQTYTPLVQDIKSPQAIVALDNALLERLNDLRATLNELDRMNAEGAFKGRLALDQVGLMGRSFGGTTTLASLTLEPRFSAGVAVVPLVMPDLRPILPSTIIKPKEQESILLGAVDGDSNKIAFNTISKPTMLLSGAEDGLIIGVGANFASAIEHAELPTLNNPLPQLRASYEETDQAVVWGLLQDSNHSSFGVSGSYWWPEMKTQRQQRYFDPQESFELVKPETAHKIQQTKVLQFFDSFIRSDKQARAKLSNNEFTDDGLIYQTRNF